MPAAGKTATESPEPGILSNEPRRGQLLVGRKTGNWDSLIRLGSMSHRPGVPMLRDVLPIPVASLQ